MVPCSGMDSVEPWGNSNLPFLQFLEELGRASKFLKAVMAEKDGKGSNQQLEQFVLLAKSARGAALVALIKQVLDAPGVYVFGELLEMPNIQELANSEHASHWKLLNIFAFGTYSDYIASADSLPELSPAQVTKLRHLSIVSLTARSKFISYGVLLQQLGITNLRELEDLIIEAIYGGIIHGKLDQKNKQLEVDFAIGRDIKSENVDQIVDVLEDWCDSCESVLRSIERQIQRANTYREKKQKQKTQVENEVENLKKAIKASSQGDIAEEGSSAVSSYQSQQYQQKGSNTKQKGGLRGSGKVFGSQVRR